MRQLLFFSLVFIAACGNNSSTTEQPGADSPQTEINSDAAPGASAQDGEIFGEWEMLGSVMDTNDNKLIDESERNALQPATYESYMKLNPDGSGLFTVSKMEGRYEIDESDGKKFLSWYDRADGRHRVGTILFVSKEELHIREPGGAGIFIWKRL